MPYPLEVRFARVSSMRAALLVTQSIPAVLSGWRSRASGPFMTLPGNDLSGRDALIRGEELGGLRHRPCVYPDRAFRAGPRSRNPGHRRPQAAPRLGLVHRLTGGLSPAAFGGAVSSRPCSPAAFWMNRIAACAGHQRRCVRPKALYILLNSDISGLCLGPRRAWPGWDNFMWGPGPNSSPG
jgi:hypothetical protein